MLSHKGRIMEKMAMDYGEGFEEMTNEGRETGLVGGKGTDHSEWR